MWTGTELKITVSEKDTFKILRIGTDTETLIYENNEEPLLNQNLYF